MAKLTLVDIANLNNAQTVVNTINNNSAAIEVAMEKTLSRDGTLPNQMDATLDMNSNRIINLPEPIADHEAATKHYVDVHGGDENGGNGNGGTAGVSSIDGVTGSLTTGLTLAMVGQDLQTLPFTGDIITAANSHFATIPNKTIINQKMADMTDASIKMNPLTDIGPVRDQRISNLTTIVDLDPLTDWLLVHDNSAGTINKVNTAAISLSAGVDRINATTGGFATGNVTLTGGAGISISRPAGTQSIIITNTGSGGPVTGVDSIDGRTGEILMNAVTGGLDTNTANQMFITPNWMKTGGSSYWFAEAGNTAVTNGLLGFGPSCMTTATNLNLFNIGMGNNTLQNIGIGPCSDNIGIGSQVMAICGGKSRNILTLTDQLLNNDQVTIGNRTYTFVTGDANAPNLIKIGPASTAQTLQNIHDAINVTGTAGVNTYGVGTLIHTQVTGISSDSVRLTIESKTNNSANNNILCTYLPLNSTRAKWHRTTLFDGGHVSGSIGIGSNALHNNKTGANIAIGSGAGFNVTTADGNILIGTGAGFSLKEGLGNNVFIGHLAGHAQNANAVAPTNGHYNIGIGLFALQWIGYGTVTPKDLDAVPPVLEDTFSSKFPQENTAIGATAGLSITTGDKNVAIGANTMGGIFDPVGGDPLSMSITGSENTAIGENALRNLTSSSSNTAIGKNAMTGFAGDPLKDPGRYNVAIGHSALPFVRGIAATNTCIGTSTGGSGYESPAHLTTPGPGFTGSSNIFIGYRSGSFCTSGSFNTLIGSVLTTDASGSPGIVAGSNNTLIGARITQLGDVSGNVVIADGLGKKVIHWNGLQLMFPSLVGTSGILQFDSVTKIVSTGAISPSNGGTGQTTWDQGDLLYASATNTLSRLPKDITPAEARYLSNSGSNNNPQWAQINLTTGVIGNLLPVHFNGGINASINTFWRGDGQWAVPSGGGGGGSGSVVGPAGDTFAGRMAVYADTSGNLIDDNIQGTATQVLHGGTNGVVSFSSVNLASDTSGFLPSSKIAQASPADGTRFLADDNTWKIPAGSGGGGNVSSAGTGIVVGRIASFQNITGTIITDDGANLIGTINTVLHGGPGTNEQAFKQIDLASTTVGGTLPAVRGGTGLATGTAGGVLYYSTANVLASSGTLTDKGIVIGKGLGGAPIAITTPTIAQLFISQVGDPAWKSITGAIALDVDGVVEMRSEAIYPTPIFTGVVTQENPSMSRYTFSHNNNNLQTTASTIIGKIEFKAMTSGSPPVSESYGEWYCQAITTTNGAEDARFVWSLALNNNTPPMLNGMTLGSSSGSATSIDLTIPNGNIIASGNITTTTGTVSGTTISGSTISGTTISGTTITATGNITANGALRSASSTSPIGYTLGAVASPNPQAPNKGSTVTCNACSGIIVMSGVALAANTSVSFTCNNSAVDVSDVIIVNQSSGNLGSYLLNADAGAGLITFTVRNVTAASLAEGISLRFAVIKGSQAGALFAELRDLEVSTQPI